MKTFLILALASLSHARAADVTVLLENYGIVPITTLGQAKAIAAGIFSKAGIRIEWKHGQLATSPIEGVQIPIQMAAPAASHKPSELGHAFPYSSAGTRITIFYEPSMAAHPVLLAHVLAHEIGHVLQGVARHSVTGVMKPVWTGKDYFEMEAHLLRFTPDDVRLLHEGLALWKAKTSGKNPML